LWGPPRWRTSPWRWRRLERVAEPVLDCPVEERSVDRDANGAPLDIPATLRGQELSRESERLADAQSHRGVKLPSESEVQQGRVRDATRHTTSCNGDPRDIML
jgi:hypothetical protein